MRAADRPCLAVQGRRSWLVVSGALLALVGACRGATAPAAADGVTTIPARASSVEVDDAPPSEVGADVAERVEQGALLADPQALELAQIGYAGPPAPLPASAEGRHAAAHLALADGLWERAAAAFQAVLEEHPESAQDFRGLALAHAGAGELDLAANAFAEALVREFPHAWTDYLQEPGFEALRASAEHQRLERLAGRLRALHERARAEGTPATVTWAPREGSRGAQAGVSIRGRFVPLAPRVWGTTVRDDAHLVVDAWFDADSDRVVNVNATADGDIARRELDALNVQVHDAVSGRALGQRTLAAGGASAFEVDAARLRYRDAGRAGRPLWLDLRGRKSTAQDEAAGATVIVRASGVGVHSIGEASVHRIAFAL